MIKNKLVDFNKPHHVTLAYTVGIQLDELVVLSKLNSEYGFAF